MRDFLVEIHTEELPPKSLWQLASHFSEEVQKRLTECALTYARCDVFATPMRLAVRVHDLLDRQPDTLVERKGPPLSAAYDAEGHPTPACIGFAKNCGTGPQRLIILESPQGKWVGHRQKTKGKKTETILPALIESALNALPIAKRMRWGNHPFEFVRPVHSVIMLYGKKIIPCTLLGVKANRKTRGHRFMSPGWLSVPSPESYETLLEKHFVIANFEKRKNTIQSHAKALADRLEAPHAEALMTEELLDEVTGLVEWPEALQGSFDPAFLEVPQEILISAMQDHQRYFPVLDDKNKLLPFFITISNIQSKQPKQVILGNERVLRARLADAAFFFSVDKKQKLMDRLEPLKEIVYQQELGNLYDKAQRLAHLTADIVSEIGGDVNAAKQAGLLAKTDLTTQLVSEFPECQGIAGYYYALHEQWPLPIAKALQEHYLPRFSKDRLPTSTLGAALAIADRADALIGAFGTHQPPTGDKDPFGLRRATLGLLRILIDQQWGLDLKILFEKAIASYQNRLTNKDTLPQVLSFVFERFRPFYQEQGIPADVVASVAALRITKPYDFHQRVLATHAFKAWPGSEGLAVANKRVSHILDQLKTPLARNQIDPALFEHPAERQLADALRSEQKKLSEKTHPKNYMTILTGLATLQRPVDVFFDEVLVMAEDQALRENRLLLLKQLRELFLNVADIALLQWIK